MAAVDKYDAEVKCSGNLLSGKFFVYKKGDKDAKNSAVAECKKASGSYRKSTCRCCKRCSERKVSND